MLMKHLSLAIGVLTCICASALAQEEDVPIYIMEFGFEEDYAQYAEWIGDLENIRFALIQSGKTWSPEVEAWAREYVQNPAKIESNDGMYLITYAEGGVDAETAGELLETIIHQYGSWLNRKQEAARAQQREEWEDMLAALNEEASESGIVSDVSKLQEQLADVSQRLLEAQLEVAQAEARVKTIMEHVEARMVVPRAVQDAENAQRELLNSKLANAELSLARSAEMVGRGLASEAETRRAELQLMEIKAEMAELEAQSVQRVAQGANTDMKRVLIDSESDRAAALALERVLSDRQSVLREKIARALDLQQRIKTMERRLGYNQPLRGRVQELPAVGRPDMIRPEAREEIIRERRNQAHEQGVRGQRNPG